MVDALNLVAALACLALSVALAGGLDLELQREAFSDAERVESVVDATGTTVRARPYRRIASATTIGDQVLDAILEPERLVAVTGETMRSSETPWRHHGRTPIEDLADLEAILALDADLVVVANVAEARRVARLREAGLRVFDIGSAGGVEALTETMRDLGALVAAPERAERLARRFERRMEAIAPERPDRPRAIYVGTWGPRLFGGAAGTSYHDVLDAAGLEDAAAEAGFEGWPAYSMEEIVQLDPPWIVTRASDHDALCRREPLATLTACREGQVVGIDDALIGDPGLGMLPAAEAVHARVFGQEPERR